jgi:anti-sigma factor RsiW
MNCEEARQHLHDSTRGRLEPARQVEVGAHVQGCEACRRAAEAELALDELLEHRLPRYAAPRALKQRLALRVGAPPAPAPATRAWARRLTPALAACAALAVAGPLLLRESGRRSELASLTSEVVNDHLRVLASQHPLDIESGGNHQVKPWFEGKLDFAPVVPAPEGSELRLRGGSLGYVFDRKAAVLVYGLRLHVVTLLVFRSEGLPWPDGGGRPLGPVSGREASSRGFNVVFWRDGELGYVLVSDVNAKELGEVAGQLAAATVPRGAP